jgi:vacuolar-type H+-ATPase subunit E/Vma4
VKDLNEQKKIPDSMYGDLYSSFEGALNQLKAEAENAIADVEKEVDRCASRVKELNSALINLEIEREIGQISEESYQTAMEIVKEGLRRINAEKNDFETLKNKLSNMLLDGTAKKLIDEEEAAEEQEEPLPSPTSEPLETSLPEPPEDSGEPPVVVYVKNADESGP